MTIDDTWRELEQSAEGELHGILRRRVAADGTCDLFLAVQKPSNQRMLIMPLETPSDVGTTELPSGRGIETSISLRSELTSGPVLQAVLIDSRFASLFTALVSDLIDTVGDCATKQECGRAFVDRLRRWQRFLEQPDSDLLGATARQGLFGELWFLREYLLEGVGYRAAMDAWKGPLGAAQDFLHNGCGLEVKTTGTKQPQSLWVNSERQLDDRGLRSLILIHLSVDAGDNIGESLAAIVRDIARRVSVDASAADAFEDRLLLARYRQDRAREYEQPGYHLRAVRLFQVTDGFPRILESDIRAGVGDVRYSIAASECLRFAVPDTRLKEVVTGHQV